MLVAAIADAKPKREPVAPAAFDNASAMDAFRKTLAAHRAGQAKQPLRISFFGDSLIATDHICDNLRGSLGKLVGNGGPGFVWAAEPHPYVQQSSVTLLTGSGWNVHGVSTQAPMDRLLGLGGSAEGGGTIRWIPKAPVTSIDVHYLEQDKGGTFDIVVGKSTLATVTTAGEKKKAAYKRVELPSGKPQAIELRAKGRVRLFGAALEASTGVVVDNLGIVNATAKGMARLNLADHLRNQLAHRASDLVIVMFGTNEAEWLVPNGAGMQEHEVVMGELLASVRAANPNSSCLVVSPLDQLDWRLPNAPPRTSIPAMVDAQKRAAIKHGCAFWNTYAWMGGKGASGKWFKQGLLIKDFQHPTVAGAQRISDALHAGLIAD
jgi:lysophospholipase L1-like esterase